MDAEGISRRIAYWRDRRGFTQADFGHLMGQTRRWVQDLEGGQRQQDPRLSVLIRAAEVLRVPLECLLNDQRAECDIVAMPAEAVPVLDVLDRHDVLARAGDGEEACLPTAALRRQLAYCCEAFQACHYAALGKHLPALIVSAHRLVAAAPSGNCEAQGLLSRVYQLTASFLHKYGESTKVQAAIAADRALIAAEQSADPVAIGAASRRVAKSMVSQGRGTAAAAFATASATRLASDLRGRGPVGLSTLGMLYLNAALAASGEKEKSSRAIRSATDLVEAAADVAQQQGSDLNADWTAFGPTNVGLHRIDVLVRFEDGWSALAAASGLDDTFIANLAKERRAQHRLSMARAQLLTRRKDAAVQSLLEADALAPEEVRRRPSTVHLVKTLISVHPQPGEALQRLAKACGLRG
ncbi:helix-turn-helix domain-containing protein [Streptomyces sp. NPDC127068]|uniref:helix-turn-helix domain-containing protein n=1 Tax=Streptomyces sp. NPDC127068 TaxID=3347127 RepID=UPI00365102D4